MVGTRGAGRVSKAILPFSGKKSWKKGGLGAMDSTYLLSRLVSLGEWWKQRWAEQPSKEQALRT